MTSSRPSLSWTLFLLVLLTTQIPDGSEAKSIKFKRLIKKLLLLRALSGGKKVAIIPLPIPLNLILDTLKGLKKMPEEMPKMPEMMPLPMMSSSYPMYMPSNYGKMMMGPEMMMPKAEEITMPKHPEMMMPHQEQQTMGSFSYPMYRGA